MKMFDDVTDKAFLFDYYQLRMNMDYLKLVCSGLAFQPIWRPDSSAASPEARSQPGAVVGRGLRMGVCHLGAKAGSSLPVCHLGKGSATTWIPLAFSRSQTFRALPEGGGFMMWLCLSSCSRESFSCVINSYQRQAGWWFVGVGSSGRTRQRPRVCRCV